MVLSSDIGKFPQNRAFLGVIFTHIPVIIVFYFVSMVDYSNAKIEMHVAVTEKSSSGLKMIRLQ